MSAMPAVGNYPLRRVIAQGSMGVVYESVEPRTGRRVALKVLRRDLLESAEAGSFLARFRAEARAATELHHPGILAVYAHGEEAGCAYMVMEYVDGRSLHDCLERGVAFSLAQSINILSELLDALDYAHTQGVWHRDIKPSNILVTSGGQIKIADFGIARTNCGRAAGGELEDLMGTPGYVAPETYLSDTFDSRVDLFAAGAVFYQLLTGIVPFAGTAERAMFRTCHEIPRPPSEVAGVAALRAYDAVVLRALAKRPQERFSSAREFREALLGTGRTAGRLQLQPRNQLGQPAPRDELMLGRSP